MQSTWNWNVPLAVLSSLEEQEKVCCLHNCNSRKIASEFWISFYLDSHMCLRDVVLSFPTQMGQFYYSAQAFDVLERQDPNPEYWEGKRGACVGIFQMILAGREPKYVLLFCVKFSPSLPCLTSSKPELHEELLLWKGMDNSTFSNSFTF